MIQTVKLCDDNFIDGSFLSDTVSSEHATYLYSQLLNKTRRSKFYRSQNTWEIVSGQNTLIFRETASTNITATVAAGTYTTSTSFYAAVKAALELTGDSTYTVSADGTTGKIKIVSNGSGGAGVFKLVLDHADSAYMAGILGFATGAILELSLTYTADFLRMHTGEWFKWDFGTSTNPHALIMLAAKNGELGISPSATVTIQGSETDLWVTPSFEVVTTMTDFAVCYADKDGIGDQAYRYWRILIEDFDSPLGYIQINNLFFGAAFIPSRGSVQFGASFNPEDRSLVATLEGGQTFGESKSETERFSLEWFGLTYQEKERLSEIFKTYGLLNAFYIVVDSDSVISSDPAVMARWVKFSSNPTFTITSPNNYSCRMELREEI